MLVFEDHPDILMSIQCESLNGKCELLNSISIRDVLYFTFKTRNSEYSSVFLVAKRINARALTREWSLTQSVSHTLRPEESIM